MHQQAVLLACAAIETGLNKLRQQSPHEYAAKHNLRGRVLCIRLTQLDWPIYILFAREIQVFSRYDGDIDVAIDADITTLYKITEGANLTELIKQDKLIINGDLTLLQTFSLYIQHNPFDFAEPLSHYLGDAPTHRILTGLHAGKLGLTRLANHTMSHLEQLATQEYRLAATRLEFIHLSDNIADTEQAVKGLEQRIKTLLDKAGA